MTSTQHSCVVAGSIFSGFLFVGSLAFEYLPAFTAVDGTQYSIHAMTIMCDSSFGKLVREFDPHTHDTCRTLGMLSGILLMLSVSSFIALAVFIVTLIRNSDRMHK